MKTLLTSLGITTFGKLGRCLFCMRAAFVSAIVVSLLAVVALALVPWTAIAAALLGLAAAFSLLWLAHLTAYAIRFARWQGSAATERGHPAGLARRHVMTHFARALALIALATALPQLSKPAAAAGDCPAGSPHPCGPKWCCSSPSRFHCEGYTGTVPAWRQRGHFCVQSATLEDQADLRSNCAILIQC